MGKTQRAKDKIAAQIVCAFGPAEWQDGYPYADTAYDVVEEMVCEHGLASLGLAADLGEIKQLYAMSDDTIGVELMVGEETVFWRGERSGWDDPDQVLDVLAFAVFERIHEDHDKEVNE